jgi:hypothetical protein
LKGCNAFETLGTAHPVTWHHMPENFNSQLHQCRNLKTHMWVTRLWCCYMGKSAYRDCSSSWIMSSRTLTVQCIYRVRQWIGRFCNTVFFWFGNTATDSAIAIFLPILKLLVVMEPWTGAQSVFAVKVFYKNDDSSVIAQREFRREFRIHRNHAVPSVHAIKTWVWNLEATGSTLKKKGGSVKSVERWLQTARVTQSSKAQNGVKFYNGVSHYRNVLGCTYCLYTTTIHI